MHVTICRAQLTIGHKFMALFVEIGTILKMIRPRKNVGERVINAGISLPPKFIDIARNAAKIEGFETLTSLVRYLITQWLQEMEKKWERDEIELEKFKCAEPSGPPPRKRGRPKKQN